MSRSARLELVASCGAFDLAGYPTSFSLRRRDLIQPPRDSVDARRRTLMARF